MDPRPTVTVLITTEQIIVSPAPPPAGGVPRVLETAQGAPPGSRPEPALAHRRGRGGWGGSSVPGASRAARPGRTDVARWRRGRPERTLPRPGMMWPRGPGRPAAKSTRGCTVQLSRLRLEMMSRLLAPRLAGNPRNAGSRSEGGAAPGRASPGLCPQPPHGHLGPERSSDSQARDDVWALRVWCTALGFALIGWLPFLSLWHGIQKRVYLVVSPTFLIMRSI